MRWHTHLKTPFFRIHPHEKANTLYYHHMPYIEKEKSYVLVRIMDAFIPLPSLEPTGTQTTWGAPCVPNTLFIGMQGGHPLGCLMGIAWHQYRYIIQVYIRLKGMLFHRAKPSSPLVWYISYLCAIWYHRRLIQIHDRWYRFSEVCCPTGSNSATLSVIYWHDTFLIHVWYGITGGWYRFMINDAGFQGYAVPIRAKPSNPLSYLLVWYISYLYVI